MENEVSRESLIYILKSAKVYLVDLDNDFEKIYDKKDIMDDIKEIMDNIDILYSLDKINEVIPNSDRSNYKYLIDAEMSELSVLLSKKSLLIDERSTIEDISEQILNLDNPSYEKSLLYRMKYARKNGIKEEYKFIREN